MINKCRFKAGDLFFYSFHLTYWIIGKIISVPYLPNQTLVTFDVERDSREYGYKSGHHSSFSVGSLMYDYAKIIKDNKEETILAMIL